MTAPTWSAVDDTTADLLALVADEGHVSADHEWDLFVAALHQAADYDGTIRPNVLRPLVRGKVAPRRIGAFVNRAVRSGLVAYTGDYEISDDTEGRNAGRPARVMRLTDSPRPPAG